MPWRESIVGQGLLIVEASRSHSDTPHSVGLLWTSDQPDAETATYTKHNTHKRQISMPQRDFFLIPGFSPLIHLYYWSPFCPACHLMFHAIVHTSNTTQTSMPPVGFEPTILVSERPQTHALDRTATGIGVRTRNPSKRAAADPRLRPCGHWDRHRWRGCKHEQ